MNKLIKKNKKQRLLFQINEINKLIVNSISKNTLFSAQIRSKVKQKNFQFFLNSSITRIKNRCIITGRSKSVYRFFKLSRIQLRLLASNSKLPGVTKYSW